MDQKMRGARRWRRAARALGLGLVVSCVAVSMGWAEENGAGVTVLSEVHEGWVEGGTAVCMDCHDEPEVMPIFETRHAVTGDRRTPMARGGCEVCHGPGEDHAEYDADMPVRFGTDHPPGPQNAVCLDCHQGGSRMHWIGSTHQTNDLACSTCHTVHAETDAMLRKDVRPETFVKDNQSQACFSCHPQVRAQIHRVSSHPFKEGRVECSDCHNPHGSMTDHLLAKDTVNQTCYSCHAEKRGPFLWEHQPARDDCLTCHVPHGSTHPTLLATRTPWLCQSCHQTQFHPSTAFDGSGLPNASPNRNLLLRNCLNCHNDVHGSNHPSGVRFTR